MPAPGLDDLLTAAIGVARCELQSSLEEFGQTKLGRVVREGGKRIIEAHRGDGDVEGEIVDFLEELPAILADDEPGESESES